MIHRPNLLRRLAAIFYDLLLLLSVLFVATALILPFNAGEAFTQHGFYSIYLLTLSFIFYGWFWTHGGQTLGLRAWKLQVLTIDQQPISWTQAFWRFIGAIVSWSLFGLGFGWSLLDKGNRCWHDIVSNTNIFIKN
jgi:uncharacterized RDD family membrane protein YckC